MSSITNDYGGCTAGTLIDPDTMWRGKLSFPFSDTTKTTDPFGISIVTVYVRRTITVDQEKPAILQESEIGR